MRIRLGTNTKIFLGWGVIIGFGIYGFVYSKQLVDKQRYQNMKSRERMRNSNIGDYTLSERFAHTKDN